MSSTRSGRTMGKRLCKFDLQMLSFFYPIEKSQQVFPNRDLNLGHIAPQERIQSTVLHTLSTCSASCFCDFAANLLCKSIDLQTCHLTFHAKKCKYPFNPTWKYLLCNKAAIIHTSSETIDDKLYHPAATWCHIIHQRLLC